MILEKIRLFISKNVAFAGLIFVVIAGGLINPLFLTPENMNNMLRFASIIGFVAIGMTFVILCGSIDLSTSSVFAFAGFLFITLGQKTPALAIVIPILAGMAIGLVNGFLVTKMSIPAFVGTLATMIFVRSLVLICTKETTINGGNIAPFLKFLGRGNVFPYVSMPFVLFIILTILVAYMMKKMPVGRAMYIVGGNPEAAKMMGVSPQKTLFTAHIFCGAMAAFGGIIFASRIGSALPLAGTGYELYAIASVVIGGAELSGGKGKISGTFFGALVMGSFSNIFNMQRILNAVWQNVVIGAVLLLVIFIQALMASPVVMKKRKNIRV
ncbi:MAG: ABC transporter permease [Treponema sp.]|jgi:ribose transport system permease protein|nr:ABC transporter permease [Treponema sp.]